MEDMRLVITRQAHLAGLDDEYVPITIARAESGLDPSKVNEGGYGLFQLHRGGLAQSSLSDEELLDPHVNASLAIRGMLGNYRAGVSKGLTGIALVQYVAYYSGWPTFQGPEHASEAFPDYGKKLAAAYLEERNAEEADSGKIVTHPAPPVEEEKPEPVAMAQGSLGDLIKASVQPEPAPAKEPEPETVKEPEPAPAKEPEPEPPAVVDNVVDSVDKPAEQSEDEGRELRSGSSPSEETNVQPQEEPKPNYTELSLHTGVPAEILEGYANRGGSLRAVPYVYRVKAGETLADICLHEGAEYVKVLEVNRVDPQHMYTGQVIYL